MARKQAVTHTACERRFAFNILPFLFSVYWSKAFPPARESPAAVDPQGILRESNFSDTVGQYGLDMMSGPVP